LLNVYISSTYRNIAEYRSKILDKLEAVFEDIGIETFIPNGSTSQETCISNLKQSDMVIFIISPAYGTILYECLCRENCQVKCLMKSKDSKITSTLCEFNIAKVEGIPHQTYLVLKDVEEARLRKGTLIYEDLIASEYCYGVCVDEKPDIVDIIREHLANNVIKWYTSKKIRFNNFCNRRKELNELTDNINRKVELHGVGGVGKTALVQVALLIQKLKGKNIVAIGLEQSYASGSGFEVFKKKGKKFQHKAKSIRTIAIHDILDALPLPNIEELRNKGKKEIIQVIVDFVDNEENILFIDDFHLADENVRDLIKEANRGIFSSRKNTGLGNVEMLIEGISEDDRLDFINLICERFEKELTIDAKTAILQITEGHPVATELLVKNHDRINFTK